MFLLSRGFNLVLGSIGVSTGQHPLILVSRRRSNTYLRWETEIPLLDLATSIPRKYLSNPKSLISNSLESRPLSLLISSSWFPVSTISSTYTIKIITLLSAERLINSVWLSFDFNFSHQVSEPLWTYWTMPVVIVWAHIVISWAYIPFPLFDHLLTQEGYPCKLLQPNRRSGMHFSHLIEIVASLGSQQLITEHVQY